MESVGSPKEEVKFNTPVPEPHLNICKGPTSFNKACKTSAVTSVASDSTCSEFNNKIMIQKKDLDDESMKPYSP